MKFIAATFFLSLASCCAFGQDKAAVSAAEAACGPRDLDFSVTADESRHPTPIPDSGKAADLCCAGGPGSTRVGADGKWLGALKRGTYFSASVDPGEHHLCARAHIGLWNHLSSHELKAKAGETYYFVAHVVGAVSYDQFAISQVDLDQGKYFVAQAKFSESRPK